ncbi:heavy metal-associated isoprenylated plant protein 19 [Carica papaya]|uniref:heavy metal-associated isoprenylated plant protein 19 n=1 Tax=Carica papaya TaxID=3649 RepID=UPI000B8D0E3C|nr:heavy metal-associated isoprenylated plant protein 19 [Carica papaya]
MANDQKKDDVKIVNVEFKVSMYCNACERTVARVISKIKGVETFTTDMNKQRVTVKGRIDAEKVLKKLRKKTGKKVEIALMMFSDENPNAVCSIM